MSKLQEERDLFASSVFLIFLSHGIRTVYLHDIWDVKLPLRIVTVEF